MSKANAEVGRARKAIAIYLGDGRVHKLANVREKVENERFSARYKGFSSFVININGDHLLEVSTQVFTCANTSWKRKFSRQT